MHIDVRNKNILVLGEGPTQGSEDATITAEAKYSISFTESGKSLHYSDSFLFVNKVKIYQFRESDSETKPYPLCLGNISKDFLFDNKKKNRVKRGCVGFFC